MKPEETDGATIAPVDLQGKNLFSVNTIAFHLDYLI